MTLNTGELADDNLAFFRKMLLKCKTILQYFNLPCFLIKHKRLLSKKKKKKRACKFSSNFMFGKCLF